ncbi:MAG: TonB-dependent receptor, partial [Gemmatimonadota bacterium]
MINLASVLPYLALPLFGIAPATGGPHAHATVISAAAVGDTVRGSVVDSAGAPIPAASVSLVELGLSTTTNREGAFVFANVPRGRQTLAARRVGFASLTRQVAVNGTTTVALTLEATALHLEAVTVTATRQPIAPLASPLSTDALSGERLRREHEVSLAQALEGFAGVRNLSTGQQVGKPVIRGLTGPRVLVLDDGLRLEDYSWSDEDGPSVDSRMAERV